MNLFLAPGEGDTIEEAEGSRERKVAMPSAEDLVRGKV
jgi:hypothetical protein